MAVSETAKLIAQLVLDDKNFSQGLRAAGREAGTVSKALDKASAGARTTANNLARIGAVGGGLALTGLALSVQEASNLNEQVNKTAVVFGDASKEVLDFSKTTADALGLAQSEALEAAGGFGNMFRTIGFAEDSAADMSKVLVTLASDMASFNNEDPSEMLIRIRAGLSGEAEPLRRFGVLISAARVEQEAYATGIAKTGEELTEAQKVQARYSLILKDTALQQGDFARTSDGLANVQRRLTANLKDTGATIGTALLPQITEIAIKINKLIRDNQPAIENFAASLPGAFDKAVAFAERIPWAAIGSGLEKAAHFAGELFDVFLSLPPEVQTTIISLAALNKLSGGAVAGVASELAKGVIKGVLGITAATVIVNARTVGGAAGGTAPVAGGTGSKVGSVIGGVAKVFLVGAAVGVFAELLGTRLEQADQNRAQAANLGRQGADFVDSASLREMKQSLKGIEEYDRKLTSELTPEAIAYQLNIDGVRDAVEAEMARLRAKIAEEEQAGRSGFTKAQSENASRQNIANERLESIRAGQVAAAVDLGKGIKDTATETAAVRAAAVGLVQDTRTEIAAIRAGSALTAAKIGDTKTELAAVRTATQSQGATTRAGLADVRGAIDRKDLSVRVNNVTTVYTNVTVRDMIKANNSFKSIYKVAS